jgi:wobble nucleotide-excising tRNase
MPTLNPIEAYENLEALAAHLRKLLEDKRFILLYAYNGTGKTRLSMEFKDVGKVDGEGDTLYFNAYTEDLFSWDNDLQGDTERKLKINPESRFIRGVKESALNLEERIGKYLERYASFNFKIDYDQWFVRFYREDQDFIKISRGEENIFIWCLFLAVCEMAIEGEGAYSWVKYIYIDDPISSLDDNNAIMVASDLARLLLDERNEKKIVLSTHHGLFYNVMWNELYRTKHRSFFLCHDSGSEAYKLQDAGDAPFFNHVAMVSELVRVSESGKVYTYHFNILRNVLERTASFFGYKDFSRCIIGIDDEVLFARALNLLSHGSYSAFEPREMVQDTKDLFNRVLRGFLGRYKFNLPEIFAPEREEVPQP